MLCMHFCRFPVIFDRKICSRISWLDIRNFSFPGSGNSSRISRHEKKIHFSEQGQHELNVLLQAIYEVLRLSFNGFSANDTSLAYRVEPLEEHIDELCDEMKNHHVERLQTGVCSIDIGFVYNDLLTNLERVADHCSNIALYMCFSEPYKRIRIAYIEAARKRPEEFQKRLHSFMEKTRRNKLITGYGGIEKYYN